MDRHTLTRRATNDRGASTAMLLTVLAGLMVLLAGAVSLLQVHIAASRAAMAADLAALAAADAARGLMTVEPCALAETTAHAHGATVDACTITAPGVAYLEISVPTPLGLVATAASRAGPKQP